MKPIEADVINLDDLMKRRQAIISERQTLGERMKLDEKPFLLASLFYSNGSRDLLQDDLDLKRALIQRTDWIIDSVYDTAIDNLDKQIEPLLAKIKNNKE